MRLLITGASGQLGAYLLRHLVRSNHHVVAWSGSRTDERYGVQLRPVNLNDSNTVKREFAVARPDVVIHAAAITNVAACHRDPIQANRINTQATAALAELCHGSGGRLLFTSTDLVFDGERGNYSESDAAIPLSIYGRTKLDAEKLALACPGAIAVRLSLLFGPSLIGQPSFFDDQVRSLRERRPVTLFTDEWRTPLSLGAAAHAIITLAESNLEGLFHLGGPERMSRFEMGRRLADFLGVDDAAIVAVERAAITSPEPRPRDASLDSSKWRSLFPDTPWPSWTAALEQMFGIFRS